MMLTIPIHIGISLILCIEIHVNISRENVWFLCVMVYQPSWFI